MDHLEDSVLNFWLVFWADEFAEGTQGLSFQLVCRVFFWLLLSQTLLQNELIVVRRARLEAFTALRIGILELENVPRSFVGVRNFVLSSLFVELHYHYR